MLNVAVIQSSFSVLHPKLRDLADIFYEVLWTEFPDAKNLFVTTEMEKQKIGFMQGLEFIVAHLDKLDVLQQYLVDMGIRHSCYGIKAKHYGWVSKCMLRSLELWYGPAWMGAVEENWTQAVELAIQVMRKGADDVRMSSG